MITIKFSHKYIKMPANMEKTKLVDIDLVDLEDLSEEFIQKDTAIVGGGHYKLPKKGKYMVLWLDSQGELWQTIRRWTPEKEAYYLAHMGEEVQIGVLG